MKPKLLKVPYAPASSFGVRQNMVPNINNRWHYHPEVELIHLHRGYGMQFIGDHIKRFEPGDILLIGSNLPHYWSYDEPSEEEKTDPSAYSTNIHFFEDFMGERFLHLPEAKPVKTMLDNARRGIWFTGKSAAQIGKLIKKTHSSEGLSRIIALMECLEAIGGAQSYQTLSSIGFNYNTENQDERINAIYNFTLNNFSKKILLPEISAVAGLVPNAFCRYFKMQTGKTYFQFLSEIRVGYACKLLIDDKLTIKQVCYESGFNNFSCFHRNFKDITGKTPQAYQRQHVVTAA